LVIANIIAAAICLIFAKPIAKICFMPFYAIVPPVVAFVFIGALLRLISRLRSHRADDFLLLGFFMRRYAWPRAPPGAGHGTGRR
jgi:TctA family transporter